MDDKKEWSTRWAGSGEDRLGKRNGRGSGESTKGEQLVIWDWIDVPTLFLYCDFVLVNLSRSQIPYL